MSILQTGVAAENFTDTYSHGLDIVRSNDPQALTLKTTDPVADPTAIPEARTSELDKWRPALNLGPKFSDIEDVQLNRTSEKTGGNTVADWVEDRLKEQLVDNYWDRSASDITDIIQKGLNGYPGARYNSLIVNLFSEHDLQQALSAPIGPNTPCVTELQFTPSQGTLHLHIALRSQFYGLKGLGNLVAAGALLAFVATKADFEVGTVREEVRNVTAYHSSGPANVNRIANHL
ncbi:hypothetical protein [Halobacterium wangiae]|uniref:hypothetical protein n=1 Tax=Halobacterium wangiae TaxID=2902623 RepID=UPI001E53A5BB|nr:hypothetical protein [Halobacterium wangiae]